MRYAVLLLSLIVAWPLFARDVYKWTNAEGVVIYSDTYQPGAERIRVSDSKSSPGKGENVAGQSAADAAAEGYETLEIVQPENNATVRSDEGVVSVSLAITPALAEGHTIKVLVDGNVLEAEIKGTQFSLNNLNPGSHSLESRVVDAAGNTLISSNRVSFQMRKAAIPTP